MQAMFEMEISTDAHVADDLKKYMQAVIQEDETRDMRMYVKVRSPYTTTNERSMDGNRKLRRRGGAG